MFSNGATPTVDKYFLAALSGDVARFPFGAGVRDGRRRRPVQRLGPHLYACGGSAVLIRHGTREELEILGSGRFDRGRCYFLIDDDLRALAEDPDVPADYRLRIRRRLMNEIPAILDMCANVAGPSEQIINAYPSHAGHLLEPCILRERRRFRHFRRSGRFRMIYAGTASHMADFGGIAPALADFCVAHEDVSLVTFLGKQAPEILKNRRNIRHFRPLRWPLFRRFMEHASFHVALAPMRKTAVNRARSFNKFLDHAMMGAAGVYSAGACPQIDRVIEHGKSGLLVDGPAGRWLEMLEELYRDRSMTADLAVQGARAAGRAGSRRRVRDFWRRRLGIPD